MNKIFLHHQCTAFVKQLFMAAGTVVAKFINFTAMHFLCSVSGSKSGLYDFPKTNS
jgi:hypothetical protein